MLSCETGAVLTRKRKALCSCETGTVAVHAKGPLLTCEMQRVATEVCMHACFFWQEYEQARGKYIIDKELMKSMQEHAVVLHPLPRVDEVCVCACGKYDKSACVRLCQSMRAVPFWMSESSHLLSCSLLHA